MMVVCDCRKKQGAVQTTREKEEDMKQRKRGIRRMFAGAMAVLMVLSAVDVSG
ncbi:hypothetical protein [Jutongia sp.]